MLAPVRTVAPAERPVSLEEVKLFLRVDHADDDVMIGGLLDGAIDHFDGWGGILGRALVTQTWRQDFAGFGCLRLPLDPVASIVSVTYFDAAGHDESLPGVVYRKLADGLGSYVDLAPGHSWPSCQNRPDAVSVTFVAGTPAADVPPAIRSAILLHVKMNFDPDADRVRTQAAIDAMTGPRRRVGV